MNKFVATGMACVLAGGLAFAAVAQTTSAKAEISTAHAHALMAQNATSVKMAHTHLHHVINCLVGSNGQGFDASAGNPCKGKGNGAIPDSAGQSAVHAQLQTALADAKAGIAASSLSTIHSDAAKAAAALQATPTQKSSGGYSW